MIAALGPPPGQFFSWWDRLFGTYAPRADVASIGLEGYPAEKITSIAASLIMPFE